MANIDTTVTADGVVKYAIGNGVSIDVIEEKVTGATSAAVELTKTIPAYCKILAVMMKYDGAMVISTGTTIGLGISGNPDSFIESSTTVTDGHVTFGEPLTTKVTTAQTTVRVSSCNGSGAAAGTFTGSVDVKIVYVKVDELA